MKNLVIWIEQKAFGMFLFLSVNVSGKSIRFVCYLFHGSIDWQREGMQNLSEKPLEVFLSQEQFLFSAPARFQSDTFPGKIANSPYSAKLRKSLCGINFTSILSENCWHCSFGLWNICGFLERPLLRTFREKTRSQKTFFEDWKVFKNFTLIRKPNSTCVLTKTCTP